MFKNQMDNKKLEETFKLLKEKDYLKYIDIKESIRFLNEKKIKNFFLACEEEKEGLLVLKSLPYHIVLEPTNVCNLKCPLCPTGLNLSKRRKGIADINKIKNFIDKIQDSCIELNLQNWGEPTLYKKLYEIISYCREKNIWTNVSTNFSIKYKNDYIEKLVTAGLSFLRVDVDGLDQETYAKYRVKGNINLVLDNLQKVMDLKKKHNSKYPIVEATMLAMKQNEHQLEQFLQLKEKYNLDKVNINKIQINPSTSSKWLPKNKKLVYSSYDGGEAPSKASTSKSMKKCHWPWSGFVVNWDGNISACCIVDDPNSDFGNVFDQDLSKVWNSNNFISSRAEFVDRDKIINETICNICKNETHNKSINRLGDSFAIKK